MIETTCKTCGCTFTTYPSQPRIYCSRECKAKDKNVEKTCAHCGKRFTIKKSRADRPYCSRECAYADKRRKERISAAKTKERVTVYCKTCGKPIEVLASKAKRKKYCSRSCRASDPDIIARLDRGAKVTVSCDYCGKKLHRYQSQVREQTFCNMKCLGKYLTDKPEIVAKLMEIRKKGHEFPNKLEQFIDGQFPELTYVGDGKIWITTPDNRRKNPDFIIAHTNKVLEVWGDYWHDGQVPESEVDRYAELGYDCLVVWESEIKGDWEGTSARIAAFCQT